MDWEYYSGLISVREVYMQAYTDALPNNKQGLSDNIVLSLCQQESGHIWVGTNGGGINCFNSLAGEFTHYPSTLGDKVAFYLWLLLPGNYCCLYLHKGYLF